MAERNRDLTTVLQEFLQPFCTAFVSCRCGPLLVYVRDVCMLFYSILISDLERASQFEEADALHYSGGQFPDCIQKGGRVPALCRPFICASLLI